jgi:hypothetical protein
VNEAPVYVGTPGRRPRRRSEEASMFGSSGVPDRAEKNSSRAGSGFRLFHLAAAQPGDGEQTSSQQNER